MAESKNPKNPKSPLYRGLTRLLSGPIVNYRRQLYRREKRFQLDKYNFESASGQQFKRAAYDPLSNIKVNFIANQNRAERYADFDQMEYMPEIASALDIYADEMTTHSLIGQMLRVQCRNEEIKTILESLYRDVLNIEFNLFGWCRTMSKYGDFFLYLDIDDKLGIVNVIGMPSMEIERLEGEDKTNPNYIQYQWNTGGLTFENWQLAHFRILGNDKHAPYGTSVLEPCRRIWRQLTLLEDAMMAYRIVRSPERRMFRIEVGGIAPEDVEQYMQKVVTQMKRNQVIDAETGRVDLRYNPLSVEEDYFIPMRNGQGSEISSLPGGVYTGDIDDVKYLRDKLFSALKVPQSYLSRVEDGEDKTTLAQKDIRFARTIQRLQRAVVSELEKIGIVHLFTLGYKGEDLTSFKLSLNNPSKIAEMQELEYWNQKFTVSTAATEGFFSRRWVAINLLGMSEEEFLRNQREMYYDKRFDISLEALAQELAQEQSALAGQPSAPAASGGGGDMVPFGGGGDLGGGDLSPDLGGGEGDLGAPEGPGTEAAPEAAPAPEGGLPIEPPGKRDMKKGYTTIGAKGKEYYPVKYDGRKSAGRGKNIKGKYAHAVTQATTRNLSPGARDLLGLSFAKGVYENKQVSKDYLFENQIMNLNDILMKESKDEKDEV
jgi:hypothetical protein